MAFFSSPPSAPRELINLDTDDEDETGVVSQSPYFTQPTQIVEKPSVRPQPAQIPSSPTQTTVEVPASSPFRPQALRQRPVGRLANLMAPAGTSFKPPARQAVPLSKGIKRGVPIDISDDEATAFGHGDSSDDDTQPSRGDIKPTSFQRKDTSITVSTTASKSQSKSNTQRSSASPVTSPPRPWKAQMDWEQLSSPIASSQESLESIRKPSPPKQPARRRLVQGRRMRSPSPASSPAKSSKPLKPPTQLIDLVSSDDDKDDDRDDDYKVEKRQPRNRHSSPEELDDAVDPLENRVLRYLNECDEVQLVAISGVKEAIAKVMISHQPFVDLDQARRVTLPKKKTGKKSARISIGDDIVSAVKTYAESLDAIDHVIQVCEEQARDIKENTIKWPLDERGQYKTDSKVDDGKPLTPISVQEQKLYDLPYKEPKLMKGHCVMKPFQLYGLNWMRLLFKFGYGGILADDMGLGKTCQVISLMCSLVESWEENENELDERPWPNIIFVPPSTLANWAAEFERFAPGINVITYQGPQGSRDEIAEEIMEDPESHHVVLTSYTQLSRQEDIHNLKRIQPVVAVFDEGHKMKNPKTKLYKDLLRIRSKWRLILSGTPVQNNLMEMIALLRFVDPDVFDQHFETLEALFSQKFSLENVSKGAILASERVPRARTILEPFILQRRKEQVLKDMPAKTARVEFCKMDGPQAAIYKDYERRFRKAERNPDEVVVKGRDNDTNNVWIQLRKSAIHPQLFRRYFKDKDVEKMAETLMKYVDQQELRQPKLEHLINELKALSDFELHLWCRDYKCIRRFDLPDGSWGECAKVRSLLKLIRQYQANGDRALVFTRFAKVIEILSECLASEGIEHLSLQGNTDVSERQNLINQFNNDESIPVFLLTTGSGGTGINLTAANKVIIFDQSDNPQDDIQAENRAHRLGQKRPVEIIRLISEGTVEELVYKACQKKLELANKVTGWASVEMTAADMEAAVRKEMLQKSASTPPNAD
ncbi:P-loop containing nucleoside triphosphate hydrolase protein [Podospora australis]|uniref:P-loop containing nucleoside triphosphate hydrolase protein n=1 Tax=Podospora australis TaxID=1536484 RepID=A0AAN7AGP3_9PEZI|nr:P-loop containing nucleoside triphosphate hydrolase protein [Podospora australis]